MGVNKIDDLISRQTAIDALKKISFSHWFECGEYLSEGTREIEIINSNKALEAIEALSSAQPEIIRCKDCRFATLTYDGDCKYCQYLEGEFGLTDAVYFDGNDYCSHAERRTNE